MLSSWQWWPGAYGPLGDPSYMLAWACQVLWISCYSCSKVGEFVVIDFTKGHYVVCVVRAQCRCIHYQSLPMGGCTSSCIWHQSLSSNGAQWPAKILGYKLQQWGAESTINGMSCGQLVEVTEGSRTRRGQLIMMVNILAPSMHENFLNHVNMNSWIYINMEWAEDEIITITLEPCDEICPPSEPATKCTKDAKVKLPVILPSTLI